MKASIYLPNAVDERVRTTILKRAADEYGGFTIHQTNGGWVDDDGNLIEEPVEIIEIQGANETFAQSTAQWAADKTDEDCILWEVTENKHGFES